MVASRCREGESLSQKPDGWTLKSFAERVEAGRRYRARSLIGSSYSGSASFFFSFYVVGSRVIPGRSAPKAKFLTFLNILLHTQSSSNTIRRLVLTIITFTFALFNRNRLDSGRGIDGEHSQSASAVSLRLQPGFRSQNATNPTPNPSYT